MSEGFFSVLLAGLFCPFLSWLEHSTCCADSVPSRQLCCEHFGFVTPSPQQRHQSSLFPVCCSSDVGNSSSLQSSHQGPPSKATCSSGWAGKAGLCTSSSLTVPTRANSPRLQGAWALLQPGMHILYCFSHLHPVRACTQLWADTCSIKGRRCSCYRSEADKSQDRIKDVWGFWGVFFEGGFPVKLKAVALNSEIIGDVVWKGLLHRVILWNRNLCFLWPLLLVVLITASKRSQPRPCSGFFQELPQVKSPSNCLF